MRPDLRINGVRDVDETVARYACLQECLLAVLAHSDDELVATLDAPLSHAWWHWVMVDWHPRDHRQLVIGIIDRHPHIEQRDAKATL